MGHRRKPDRQRLVRRSAQPRQRPAHLLHPGPLPAALHPAAGGEAGAVRELAPADLRRGNERPGRAAGGVRRPRNGGGGGGAGGAAGGKKGAATRGGEGEKKGGGKREGKRGGSGPGGHPPP